MKIILVLVVLLYLCVQVQNQSCSDCKHWCAENGFSVMQYCYRANDYQYLCTCANKSTPTSSIIQCLSSSSWSDPLNRCPVINPDFTYSGTFAKTNILTKE